MVAFAIGVKELLVKERIAAGPIIEGSVCPPFDRTDEKLGVEPGKGFDVDTQNHVIGVSGMNNICVNWDYTPARELTAMVYPAMEYTFIVYIVLDFVADYIANMRGQLSGFIWTFTKIVFPINFFLASQFRMIFVCKADEDTKNHTLGFLGLQVAMFLIAVQNTLGVYSCESGYPFCDFLGGGEEKRVKNTRRVAAVYLVMVVVIDFVYFFNIANKIKTGEWSTLWLSEVAFGINFAEMVDKLWLVSNMVVPLFIALHRSKNDSPLQFTIKQN